jgi:TPR repeat protein
VSIVIGTIAMAAELFTTALPLVKDLTWIAINDPIGTDFKAGVDASERGDYATAFQKWEPLAMLGFEAAQFNLGVLYRDGQGVPPDYVQAHMWFNLSSGNGAKHGQEARDELAKQMTPAQITEAQKLAREWKYR